MSTVVERIERYTTRERERLERDESTPDLTHIYFPPSTRALCGVEYEGSGRDYTESECVVCRALVVQMGWPL